MDTTPPEPKPRASGVIIGVMIVVLVAAGGVGVWQWLQTQRPEARELLKGTVASYGQAQHVHVESTMSYEVIMGSQTTTKELPTEAWFSKPNRVFYRTGGQMQETTMVSTGKHLYMEMSMLSGVVKMPAPESFADLPLHQFGATGGGQFSAMRFPDVASLVTGGFKPENLKSVSYGIEENNGWLSSLEKPEGTWAMTVELQDGPTIGMWIDRRRHVVRKFATQMDYQDMMAAMGEEQSGALEQLPESMRERFETMKMRFEVDVQSAEFEKAPPQGTYAFTPDEDTKIIEAESMEEGMQELIRNAMEERGSGPEQTDLTGKPPPDFTARSLDGEQMSLRSFKGKPLVLDFWATWCPPCRKEMPILNELYGEYADQGLQIVAVSTDPSVDEVESFLEQMQIDFTILWLPQDESQTVTEKYGITGIPRTLYIDSGWTVQVDDTGLHPKQDMLKSLQKIGIQTGG